jgi:5-methyltetrahydropteroyltriglutamate--homocysteine methyltransferase
VLGLISSKVPELESESDVKRRIDEASRFVSHDRLGLSPQCGFASTYHGNKVTEADQWRKLELVVKIANDVWH